MSAAPQNVDLSHLTEPERQAYSRIANPNNLAWFTALACGAYAIMGVVVIFQATGGIHIPSIIKTVGFVGLGFWARGWSRIACLSLLGWHLYINFAYSGAAKLHFKIVFWLPAALFLVALFFAMGRASLIKKAQQVGGGNRGGG